MSKRIYIPKRALMIVPHNINVTTRTKRIKFDISQYFLLY